MKKDSLKMKIWKRYKKLFPTKCFIVMGNKVPDVPFSNKRKARKFLFNNVHNGYNVMVHCTGTGCFRM